DPYSHRCCRSSVSSQPARRMPIAPPTSAPVTATSDCSFSAPRLRASRKNTTEATATPRATKISCSGMSRAVQGGVQPGAQARREDRPERPAHHQPHAEPPGPGPADQHQPDACDQADDHQGHRAGDEHGHGLLGTGRAEGGEEDDEAEHRVDDAVDGYTGERHPDDDPDLLTTPGRRRRRRRRPAMRRTVRRTVGWSVRRAVGWSVRLPLRRPVRRALPRRTLRRALWRALPRLSLLRRNPSRRRVTEVASRILLTRIVPAGFVRWWCRHLSPSRPDETC